MTMMISVGAYEFDSVRYDIDCDVLDLRRGGSRTADIFDTPEGHLVTLDEDREVIGITFIGVKLLIDRDGRIPVTLPKLIEPDPNELAQVFAD